ncbi:MAG: hypothetical protein AMQ22_02099 [Candidatus Methanofastidiosum methylothiophilum]|jgi:hypothetical protein|uniref:PIN-like domain-containing protein n=1 Tax=Candidatus Methanofastidiosum methylothiophilum TaxID=1705564 RepID=A0A150INP3_9EURY|nr:MAG: hypothetical protein AMQ22_02099 [Candidatus Methanofastidiosum methylthiophilus]
MSASETVFIDYENVHAIDTSGFHASVCAKIIVGVDQTKIPIDLVKKLQEHGKNIEWIQVHGKGKNALDFFIAYYLGVAITKSESEKYYIYTNDKGFDPLIKHLVENGIHIERINSLKQICITEKVKAQQKVINKAKIVARNYDKIIDNLKSIDKTKRPKSMIKLHGHIKTVLGNKINDEAVNEIVTTLKNRNLISENNKKLVYQI